MISIFRRISLTILVVQNIKLQLEILASTLPCLLDSLIWLFSVRSVSLRLDLIILCSHWLRKAMQARPMARPMARPGGKLLCIFLIMNNTSQKSYFKTNFNKDILIDNNHLPRIPPNRIAAQCREFLAICASGCPSDLALLPDNQLSGLSKWRRVVFVKVTDEEISNFNEKAVPKTTNRARNRVNFFEVKILK